MFKLKPQATYSVYASGQPTPVAIVNANATGAANATAIGPLREVASSLSAQRPAASKIIVMEGNAPADPATAVLIGS